MDEITAELASLRTEVRYLKIIIPGACALVALLFLIFWGIERKNIGKRVTEALDEHAVSEAIDGVNNARVTSEAASEEIVKLKNETTSVAETLISDISKSKNSLPWANVEILSVDHTDGSNGKYFNFQISDVDAALGNDKWGNKNAVIIDVNNQKIDTAILWRKDNGGSIGTAHGRWATAPAANQWATGKHFIIVSGHTE